MSWLDAIKAGDFDGSWCGSNGEEVAHIVDRKITFQDGSIARVESRSEEVLCMVLDREVYSANLDQPGLLKWNDGDVWVLSEAREALLHLAVEVESPPAGFAINNGYVSTGKDGTSPTSPGKKVKKADIIVADPGCYRVMQGHIFKKPGADPTTAQSVQLVKEVGSQLFSTGRSWRGRHCSLWVELDNPGSPGWVLAHGEGAGMSGPLLQKVEAGEQTPFILRVRPRKASSWNSDLTDAWSNPSDESTVGSSQDLEEHLAMGERKFIVKPSASMIEVKAWISVFFDVSIAEVSICKPQDSKTQEDMGGDAVGSALAAARAKLECMKLSDLQKLACSMGISEEDRDAALNTDDPKKALVDLVLELQKADIKADEELELALAKSGWVPDTTTVREAGFTNGCLIKWTLDQTLIWY